MHLLICKAEQPLRSLHEKCSSRHPMDFKMTRATSHCGAELPHPFLRHDESDVRRLESALRSQHGFVA